MENLSDLLRRGVFCFLLTFTFCWGVITITSDWYIKEEIAYPFFFFVGFVQHNGVMKSEDTGYPGDSVFFWIEIFPVGSDRFDFFIDFKVADIYFVEVIFETFWGKYFWGK